MGRFVKNFALEAGSYAIQLPLGSSTVGPMVPQEGQIRFNTTTMNMEVYYAGAWHGTAFVSNVAIKKDWYLGDGVTSTFGLNYIYSAGQETEMLVFVGSIFQDPGNAYVVSGNTITFSSAPDTGLEVIVLENINNTSMLQ